jgi:hypothetical protein
MVSLLFFCRDCSPQRMQKMRTFTKYLFVSILRSPGEWIEVEPIPFMNPKQNPFAKSADHLQPPPPPEAFHAKRQGHRL